MAGLAINVDHIATLRQARGGSTRYPDPVHAAALAELGGADGIVVHLREDRRHIQDRDVYLLRKTVLSRLILEMAATDEMLKIAVEVKPDLVTLVPEKRNELTTEGGLDVQGLSESVGQAVQTLQAAGIAVSLFVDPESSQIRASTDADADMVEIHTGAFCDAPTPGEKQRRFSDVMEAARLAHHLELGVNAGHGLCYNTIGYFAGHRIIDEFSIGHSIVSRAALTGMEKAVREMRNLIKEL
ncbi:MAG: pyridoxine 5'-phosphate synthase [Desulfobacterales bacterium]|nr:pyridoxine 5'-phosphate synthase [Desulfobacterales bacterium]